MGNRMGAIFLVLALGGAGFAGKAKFDRLKGECAAIARTSVESQEDLKEAQESLRALRAKLGMKEGEIGELSKTTSTLSNALEASNEELKRLVTELQAQKRTLELTVEGFEKEKAQLEKAEADKRKEMAKTYENLVSELKGEIKNGQIRITQIKDKLAVKVADKIFFDSGKAYIKVSGQKVLLRVGKILRKAKGKIIRIEGHTDNLPIGDAIKKEFRSNWELSAARATTVVRFLEDRARVDPEKIYAAAFGPHQPVATNKTRIGRARNRRIEIVLLNAEIEGKNPL